MSARLRVVAAGLAAACLLAACGSSGGGGGSVPRGNPDARHGPGAVDDYAAVELLRARLVASSDSYYAGGSSGDARTQLNRARSAYDALAGKVRKAHPVLDHEVVARFDVLGRDLRRGIKPDHYRDISEPLGDQLMDGVVQSLVSQPTRTDPGVQAEALRRVTARLAATYEAAGGAAGDETARLAFQEAWGLWRRGQALTAVLKQKLGGQKNTIAGALNGLRGTAFPNGPNPPDAPPANKVDTAATKISDALTKRFALAGI